MVVERANLARENHAAAVVELLDLYARDLMGGGAPLSESVKAVLPERLLAFHGTNIFLAWDGNVALGVAVCFTGFSTFQARPLWNVHDLAVRPQSRGQGVGAALLAAVEEAARAAGCCKLTLEVRADNRARRLYLRAGFEAGEAESTAMSFFTKVLK